MTRNEKGWLVDDSTGQWISIPYNKNTSTLISANLELKASGKLIGSVTENFNGYEAMKRREIIYRANEDSLWKVHPSSRLVGSDISNKEIEGSRQNDLPLNLKYQINTGDFIVDEGLNMTLDPRLIWGERRNPFQLEERRFPIDYGYQNQKVVIININLPKAYKVVELPQKTRIVLPGKEVEYQYQAQIKDSLLTIQTSLIFRKAVLPADIYPHLKILYNRIIEQEKQTDYP